MTIPPARPAHLPRAVLISLLALAVLAGVAADLLFGALAHRVASELAPQYQVEQYLGAITAGDVKAAVKLGRIDASDGDALLKTSVYKKVPGRVTSYSISGAKVSGGTATVTAELRQGANVYKNSFALHRGRPILGVIPTWRLDEQQLPSIGFSAPIGAELKVAGVTLHAGQDSEFVFPGQYRVETIANPYFSAPAQTVDIGGLGLGGGFEGERTATIRATLTAQGTVQAEKAVVKYLAGCLAQDSSDPANCPFALDGDPGAAYTNNVWHLDQPVVSDFGVWKYDSATNALGWAVTTVFPGEVDYSGDESSGSQQGEVYTDPFAFGIDGDITSFDAQGNAVFEFTGSDYDTGSGGSGSDDSGSATS